MWEVKTECGHTMPLNFALQASTAKPLICETCFIREKRKRRIAEVKLIANGRRFRYTVPASSLPRIPLGHSSNKGFRVSYSR